MKVFIDNNIILDALLSREHYYEYSEKVLLACVDSHEGCLSVNSLTDIYYVLRKSMRAADAKAAMQKLMDLFDVIDLNREDCLDALALPIDDFEDALILIAAHKVGAEIIVTRDAKFQKLKSSVQILSPEQFIKVI